MVGAIDRREADIKERSSFAWDTIALFLRDTDKATAFVGSLSLRGICFRNGAATIVYHPDKQNAAADTTVDLLVEQLANESTTAVLEMLNSWRTQAMKTALCLKDHHFSEEQESRLVWAGHSWPARLKTRVSPTGLVPYHAFQFDLAAPINSLNHPNNFGIEEIIVGPALGQHQVSAVEALLASHHMRLTIKRSAIPYVAD